MKISISVYNLNSTLDVKIIKNELIKQEGIVACEISKIKKEIQIVYDNLAISSVDIINIIEMLGYMIEVERN